MALTVAYDFVFHSDEAQELGRGVPAITTYVELADGRIRPVPTVPDTGAGISVFDGRVATRMLGFDPRANPLGVVPLQAFGSRQFIGYVHELRCYFGGYSAFGELMLHIAFTNPSDAPLPFSILGREGLHGNQERGFFSQTQFGYRHRAPGGLPEIYLTFAP